MYSSAAFWAETTLGDATVGLRWCSLKLVWFVLLLKMPTQRFHCGVKAQ